MTVRPPAWLLTVVVAVASTAIASCGQPSSDDEGAATQPAAAGASAADAGPDETWDLDDGPGDVTVRPVVDCSEDAAPDSSGEARLPHVGNDAPCVVGPPAGSGQVFERDSAVVAFVETSESWVVDVDLRAAGRVVLEALAEECVARADGCESGRLAIVLDDVIQSAPTVETLDVSGTVRISGDLTEEQARTLARALNRGAVPVESGDEIAAASTTEPRRRAPPTSVAATASVPATTTDPAARPGAEFAMPGMCGLPAAVWTSNEHPDSQGSGTWAMGSRDEGDLDGDGQAEYAWATMCGQGTVAAERTVHVFASDRRPMGALPVEATTAETYPERRVHALEPRITDDEIEVEVWVWQPADDECCPSVTFTMAFAWDGSGFTATTAVPDPDTTASTQADESPVTDWDGIYRPTSPGRVVRLGEFGRQVEVLQRELAQRGYDIDVDGYFGDGTESAVRRFQLDRGLQVTGVAGEAVWDEFDE